jgi:hypothetical protein
MKRHIRVNVHWCSAYLRGNKEVKTINICVQCLSVLDRSVLERCFPWMMCPLNDVYQYEPFLTGVGGGGQSYIYAGISPALWNRKRNRRNRNFLTSGTGTVTC